MVRFFSNANTKEEEYLYLFSEGGEAHCVLHTNSVDTVMGEIQRRFRGRNAREWVDFAGGS